MCYCLEIKIDKKFFFKYIYIYGLSKREMNLAKFIL